jgi:hypothetical protein
MSEAKKWWGDKAQTPAQLTSWMFNDYKKRKDSKWVLVSVADAEIQKLQDENKNLRIDNENLLEIMQYNSGNQNTYATWWDEEKQKRKALEDRLDAIRKPEMLEKLAELEHEQWSELIQYFIGFAPIHGELTAKDFWREYDELSEKPYAQLTEKQKDSDRKFARKVLGVLLGEATKMNEELESECPCSMVCEDVQLSKSGKTCVKYQDGECWSEAYEDVKDEFKEIEEEKAQLKKGETEK